MLELFWIVHHTRITLCYFVLSSRLYSILLLFSSFLSFKMCSPLHRKVETNTYINNNLINVYSMKESRDDTTTMTQTGDTLNCMMIIIIIIIATINHIDVHIPYLLNFAIYSYIPLFYVLDFLLHFVRLLFALCAF